MSTHSSIKTSYRYTAPAVYTTCLHTAPSKQPICTELHQQPVSTQLYQNSPSVQSSISTPHLSTAPSVHPICTQLHQYTPSVHSSISTPHLYTAPSVHPICTQLHQYIPSVHSHCACGVCSQRRYAASLREAVTSQLQAEESSSARTLFKGSSMHFVIFIGCTKQNAT